MKDTKEKVLNPQSGWIMLIVVIILFILSIIGTLWPIIDLAILDEQNNLQGTRMIIDIVVLSFSSLLMCVIAPIMCLGFKVLGPNEAYVLLLFGKYHGSLKKEGFFFVNPFCNKFNPVKKGETKKTGNFKNVFSQKRMTLKAITLNNEKQKVNDLEGNPIEIGVVVIWRITDTAKAAFNVENYVEFVSTQADSAIRHVARLFPYDISQEGDEKSLRGSSQQIAIQLCSELQNRVQLAGIEVLEARISHLAYAPEIAAVMLQRQQASAIIDARQKIVEGAVGMVEMALNKLNENGIVNLDEERKAVMVSNLLVVLCGSKEASPVINSGTLY